MKTKFLLLSIIFSTATFASDILTLHNEMKFEGKALKIKKCHVTFRAINGDKYVISAHDIISLVFENPADPVYISYLNAKENDFDKCLKGGEDAKRYHGKGGFHVALGILFGPFAVIGAGVADPTPMKGLNTYAMSSNKDLFQDPAYLNCYAIKARHRNVGKALLGWGAWILFVLII